MSKYYLVENATNQVKRLQNLSTEIEKTIEQVSKIKKPSYASKEKSMIALFDAVKELKSYLSEAKKKTDNLSGKLVGIAQDIYENDVLKNSDALIKKI